MATDERATKLGEDELALVVGRYALGDLTLGEAAEHAGVSRLRMQELLRSAGVEIRLGPADAEAARREVDEALDLE